jgi:ABC-type antimicrobial peptide transport system permease subunit
VRVYGVDDRFFAFHGVPPVAFEGPTVRLSPDLAAELGAAADDSMLVRVARPTDIPLDSLHGRRDEVGRAMRLRSAGVLGRESMGEFSLAAEQGPVRAVFVALDRLQGDLDQPDRVNTLLIRPIGAAPLTPREIRSGLSGSLAAEDLGLTIAPHAESSSVIVESSAGLMADSLAQSINSIARRDGLELTSVLSWLATRMTVNGRSVPYSLVTGLHAAASDERALQPLTAGAAADRPPIVLNEWAMRDLAAAPGDDLEIEYYRWADEGQLVTERAMFRVAGVLPMRGIGLADWDPPFPISLRLVRPIDEDYWDRYRTTPKAFIPLETAQRIWRSRHGQISSLRLRRSTATDSAALEALAAHLRTEIPRSVDPLRAGLSAVDIRAQNLTASTGATDFGAYFSYFSFFLVVSAVLLAALFFRLAVEQRLQEVGVLRAFGLTLAQIRRLFLIEGTVVALIGAMAGIALAAAWAALMVYGLRTWWSGAVGTNRLELHVDGISLAIGAATGIVAGLIGMALTIRALRRLTPRALLSGGATAMEPLHSVLGRGLHSVLAVGAFVLALGLSAASLLGWIPAVAGFFGAGTAALIGGLVVLRNRLRRPAATTLTGAGTAAIARLGIRNASWRPGRSLTSAALVAAAVFLLVSVDAFRKGSVDTTDPASGTGGFALIGESALPIVHDPASREGQEAFGIGPDAAPGLSSVSVIAARLRPGDDASCLNLYQPRRPRVLGVSPRFVELNRFSFASTIDVPDDAGSNPWRLLGPADANGVVPAIVDATSLQYVLHAAVGDEIVIDADTGRPVRLRVVASLSDSMLQGEIIIGEEAFLQLYPDVAGYRVALIDVPEAGGRIDEVTRTLEDRLSSLGLDVQESARRLEAYHRVENTYLSTFQTLGGLGLVLGMIGLVAIIARNVLERRRELALLGAAGFTGRELRTLVVAEHLALVGAGLAIGLAAAFIAIAPVLAARGGGIPVLPLVWIVVVAVTGLLAAMVATRQVRRLPLVASLRSE